MMTSEEIRNKAWQSLNGKWGLAVGTGFVASLLGARTALSGKVSFGNSEGTKANAEDILDVFLSGKLILVLLAIVGLMVFVALLYSIFVLVVGGPITLGYAKFNMSLVSGGGPRFEDLFSQFHRFKEAFFLQFLRGIIVTIGTMLLVIPGVYANYCMAMAPYILYESPGMPVGDVLQASNELMKGNKMRLFCLHLSFIGWAFLCAIFTMGIGFFWLRPYIEASNAVFYEEIKREKFVMSSGSNY